MTNGEMIRTFDDEALTRILLLSCKKCPASEICDGKGEYNSNECVNMLIAWLSEDVEEAEAVGKAKEKEK